MSSMIKVENLSKVYEINDNEVVALKDISFNARKGEILGFVGRSGGGKSTLLKIIRGMEKPDSGRIIMDGLTVTPDSGDEVAAEQMELTAIHLQRDFALWTESALRNVLRRVYSRTTGFEILPDPELVPDYQEMYNEAMYYLKLVGLDKKATHLATILSGGEKQRLIIARQLAKKPKILLLDEPATMACPATKQEVLDAIKNIREALGITILVVSHLPEIHRYLVDRLIWLDKGQIVSEGMPDEILRLFLSGIRSQVPLTPRSHSAPMMKVEGISKRCYLVGTGEVLNVENLSFNLKEGEITSIIGSSGAGKTTLLKMVEGLKAPDEGSILYKLGKEWVDITTYSPQRMEIRRSMAIMYQEFALSFNETILDQIAYQLGVKGQHVIEYAREVSKELGISDKVLDILYTMTDMQEEEAKLALEALGLTREVLFDLFPRFPTTEAMKFAGPVFKRMDLDEGVLWKLPEQLSGGEKVRASIAILLAANPRILMLDEPFGDIDPITLRDVSNAIKKINSEYGTTIVIVSHHVDFVREVSHRAILIENGAIAADGDPNEVCDAFLDRCGAAYLCYPTDGILT